MSRCKVDMCGVQCELPSDHLGSCMGPAPGALPMDGEPTAAYCESLGRPRPSGVMRALIHDMDGATWCDTPAEAAEAAAEALAYAHEAAEADREWPPETDAIAWALVIQIATEEELPRRCRTCSLPEGEHNDPSVVEGECDAPDWEEVSSYSIADAPDLAEQLVAILRTRPELWAELQDAMRTATGGPLPSSDCVGGGR